MITGSWGTQGDLKVEVLTNFLDRFSPGSVLYLDGHAARVVQSRRRGTGYVVKLDLVNDRGYANSLRGKHLTVPEDELKQLPTDSYYYFQLIGMGVWDEEGEFLGDIREILSTGSNDVYVVQDTSGKEVLLPAVKSVVLQVDSRQNRMVVQLPEGLR